jgi:hypothetical protein
MKTYHPDTVRDIISALEDEGIPESKLEKLIELASDLELNPDDTKLARQVKKELNRFK